MAHLHEMNEADVRGEIIDPLLRRLGYGMGTEYPILRERTVQLRYPNAYLGKKSPGKDPALRGRADYICEVRGFGRWVVEAKPPSQDITLDDVEQAHSYSTHPEIQARFFVLSNGHRALVFESNRGPGVAPLLEFPLEDLESNWFALQNLLSPEAIKRHYTTVRIDPKRPLAPGFGSKVQILNGSTTIDTVDIEVLEWPASFPKLALDHLKRQEGTIMGIIGDRCWRAEDGSLNAEVRMPPPHQGSVALLQQVGFMTQIYTCRDPEISQQIDRPSRFEYTSMVQIPAGTDAFDHLLGQSTRLPVPVELTTYAEAIGSLSQNTFGGTYLMRQVFDVQLMGIRVSFAQLMRGRFDLVVRPE